MGITGSKDVSSAVGEALEKIRSNCIEDVDLYEEGITPQVATSIANALKENTSVTSLKLANNKMQTEGVSAIAKAIAGHRQIKHLYFGLNQAQVTSLKECIKLLEDPECTIETFMFGGNFIHDEGATALAKALEVNTSIRVLGLNANDIGPGGAKALAAAFKANNRLRIGHLELSDNKIGEDGARKLCDGLYENNSLRKLDLTDASISEETRYALLQIMERNKKSSGLAV